MGNGFFENINTVKTTKKQLQAFLPDVWNNQQDVR